MKEKEKQREMPPQAQILASIAEMKEKDEESGEKEKLVVAAEE